MKNFWLIISGNRLYARLAATAGGSLLVVPLIAIVPALGSPPPTGNSKIEKTQDTTKQQGGMVDGFRIISVSDYSGQYKVVVAKTGSKISHERSGLSYLTHPKSDDVTVFNEREKTFCTMPFQKWKAPFSTGGLVRGDQFIDLRVEKVEKLKECGVQAEKKTLETTRKFDTPAVERAQRLTVIGAEIVETSALSADQTGWKVIASLCGIPASGGYPLTVSYVNRKHKEHSDLKTEILKPQKMPAAEFEVPSSFKKVADLKHVYANSGDNASFKDILEGF